MKLQDAVRLAKTVRVEHAKKFATHVVPEVVRPARVIWNQAIGAIFLLFALVFFSYALKYYNALSGPAPNPLGLGLSAFMGVVMTFFGIGSFRKANAISSRK